MVAPLSQESTYKQELLANRIAAQREALDFEGATDEPQEEIYQTEYLPSEDELDNEETDPDQEAEGSNALAEEIRSRLLAKAVGNGSNALDTVGWDGWITFTLSYIYLMARGFVSLLSPETIAPQDYGSFKDAVNYNTTKALHKIFPPYRPLQEPGDFAYFLFLFVISITILVIVVSAVIMLVQAFLLPILFQQTTSATL